ncbi:hypothetical protein NDU88_000632 [Pleurodeles waltl]|uniref:Uncharacterized protein n=1 Tax=Pleurodeles waltl TaxID=8319 RepID=A0AAV7P8T5_PLEWA|nr:hypothetical protein NDU88_000632 [Pleurodeles waltl]
MAPQYTLELQMSILTQEEEPIVLLDSESNLLQPRPKLHPFLTLGNSDFGTLLLDYNLPDPDDDRSQVPDVEKLILYRQVASGLTTSPDTGLDLPTTDTRPMSSQGSCRQGRPHKSLLIKLTDKLLGSWVKT